MAKTFLPQILQQKAQEVANLPQEPLKDKRPAPSFYELVKGHPQKIHIIAEVKKASPSMGDINLDLDIVQQAQTYERAGASMISVLTDELYFKGSTEDIRAISATVGLPTLNKDFIIDEKQIIRARNAGATVILLIVAALSPQRLKQLYDYAYDLGLEVLVETHTLEELAVAHQIGAKIIGVNNRDLVTFEISLETSIALSEHFQDQPIYICESGLFTGADVSKIADKFDGILVGTALMTAENVAEKVKELAIDKG